MARVATKRRPSKSALGFAYSERLAEFAHDLRFDDIPEPVRRRAKYLILDSLGIALAASRFPFAPKFLAGLQGLTEPGNSSVIGMSAKLPLRDAALINGALVHSLDFDDTHMKAVVHATAVSLPTALSVGESTGANGRDFLVAYLIGMETAIRLGMASNFGFHHLGLHATGIVGHFSSALVAGRLFGLDSGALTAAQGITGSTAQASQQFIDDGAWNKRLHPGWAATAGITAAGLANSGFVAPRETYEGRFGVYKTMVSDPDSCDLSLISDGLGERWEATESAVKPFPTCHFTHAAADAALILRQRHAINADDIVRIRALLPAETFPFVVEPVANKKKPASDYDAKFSTHYIVAACFRRGRFGLDELDDASLGDPEILDLAAKVECEVDPDSDFPRVYPGGIIVTTADGCEYAHHEPVNRGAAERALSGDDVVEKFFANAERVVSAARAREIADRVLDIDNHDVRGLAKILSGA